VTTTVSEPPTSTATRPRGGRVRGFIAWLLIVVAGILVPLAMVAYWGQRSITDTEQWVTTVAPLAQDQAIRDQVSTATSEAILKQIDNNTTIDDFLSGLPPRAQEALKTPIEAAINGLVTQVVNKIVNSTQFQELWINANRTLQSQIIGALSGDESGAVTLQNDEIVLDIGTVIEAAKRELVDRGVTALADRPVPPAADRQIVLMKGDQVKQAQLIYALTIPLARLLLPLVAVLFLAAVAISTRRARVVMGTGIAIALGLAALSIGLTYAREAITNSFSGTAFQSVVEIFYITLTRYLSTAISAGLTLGIVIAVIGWYGGRSRPATAVRQAVGGGLRSSGARVKGGGLAGVGAFLRARGTLVKVVIGLLATVALFLFEPISVSSVLWLTVIALALVAVVDFLAGIGDSEAGQGSPTDGTSATLVTPTTT
jgi:hypothetical protein